MRAFPGPFWHSDETEDTDANPGQAVSEVERKDKVETLDGEYEIPMARSRGIAELANMAFFLLR